MENHQAPIRRQTSGDRVGELIEDVKAYARQETVDPIRGAARWVAAGTAGAMFLGLSVVFLSMGVLRLTQSVAGDTLDGSWSFVPYVVTVVVLAVVVAFTFSRVSQRSLRKGQ